MSVHEEVKTGIPAALKAHEEVRLRTLRSLSTAMTNEVVSKKRKPSELLTDEEALAVIKRAANQRKDSIEQFEQGGRPELAVPEKDELAVLEAYLPAQMDAAEVEPIVRAKMQELGITSKADSGKLIGALMKELKGKADGNVVKGVMDSLLS